MLERQVLGYDEVTRTLDEKLLLLNIARVSNSDPVHFTSTSSIAATFNWTTTRGVSDDVGLQTVIGFAYSARAFCRHPSSSVLDGDRMPIIVALAGRTGTTPDGTGGG